ncbi:MAG: methylated-DNA--[protein]-cysteine S-methyltransferase [Bacteroidales bacterium]|nr:methylated-DNA--[protein]-cysteine S-methyltransferase [Bacteroidales bacterium]
MAEWIVIEIDGKIASVAGDYRHLPRIASEIAKLPAKKTGYISTRKISTEQLLELAANTSWEDLRIFGTKFQLSVWKTLYGLEPRLYSYSEFAHMVDNPQGVRAVAHAVAANPVAYIIPCHLIVPKESVDKAREIRSLAEKTLFQGRDLYLLDTLDVGEYAYGPELKREFIKIHLAK